VLEAELERLRVRRERAVLLPGAALRAVRAELLDRDAHGTQARQLSHAAVGEDAAAAEAGLDEIAVSRVDRWLGVATCERAMRSGR